MRTERILARICLLGSLILSIEAPAYSEPPSPGAQRFALELPSASAYYQVTLTEAAIAASLRDLDDLRVFNGAGEPVPYTLEGAATPAQQAAVQDLAWFPLPADATASATDLGVTIEPDGRLRAIARPSSPATDRGGDLVDLGPGATPLSALLISLSNDTYLGRVDISASDDLRQWTPVTQAQLLKTHNGAAILVQKRVELDGVRARYLRLKWPDGAPAIAALQAESVPDSPPPARQWRTGITMRPSGSPGEYRFDSGGAYPVDRVQFELPQPNTVARGQLYSRVDGSTPWRLVAEGQLLRLQATSPANGEQHNPPWSLDVDTDRQWLLRVDTRGGGLGGGTAKAILGWQPVSLTFAARGPGPFVLEAGDPSWHAASVSREELLPPGSAAPAQAQVGQPLGQAPAQVPTDPQARRRYVLWAVLVAAVAMLGIMAWRLMRPRGPQA
ncbi:MAG TPA: DUF3999 domain-containing protein [Bordetella sp.]